MIKYAVVSLSYYFENLQINVVLQDFDNIRDAENARSEYLKICYKLNPQNVQVTQYTCEQTSDAA